MTAIARRSVALRSVRESRVREVLAAFDRQCMSPVNDGPSMMCLFMTVVADTGVDRFQIPGGWTDAGIRAVLVAFLLHAPDEDLDEMVEKARKENVWIEGFERESAEADALEQAVSP